MVPSINYANMSKNFENNYFTAYLKYKKQKRGNKFWLDKMVDYAPTYCWCDGKLAAT